MYPEDWVRKKYNKSEPLGLSGSNEIRILMIEPSQMLAQTILNITYQGKASHTSRIIGLFHDVLLWLYWRISVPGMLSKMAKKVTILIRMSA